MNSAVRRKIARTLHWFGVIGNFALAAVTVFSAYGGMINPDVTSVGALAAMMFPAILLVTVVVTVINMIWFRRHVVVNCLSIVACAGPILTLCPLNFFRPSVEEIERSGDKTLKVMTFNIMNFNTFSDSGKYSGVNRSENPTLRYILEQDADIVLCQEGEDLNEGARHRFSDSQLVELDSVYPYHHVTHRGMAILSKYPFEKVPVCVADPNQLDLIRYDVDVNGQTLHLFSVHMQSIGLTSGDKAIYRHLTEGSGSMDTIRATLLSKLSKAFRLRALQARDVRNSLDLVDGMVMLCGDFNDIPGSYAARVIESDDMIDAYTQAGLGPAITYHGDRFFFRIDHIFYRGPLDALRVWRGNGGSSDHYPMIGIFRLK